MQAALTKILLLGLIVITALGSTYWYGHTRGAASIQAQWDADKEADRISYWNMRNKLAQKLAEQEATHVAGQKQVSDELAQVREAHGVALLAQRSGYEQRLLQSSRRAQVYREQAEGSTTSCRDLAGHAAQLDRTLEEGRSLVAELRGTLGLRDQQVTLLGKQILTDRLLLAGEVTEESK